MALARSAGGAILRSSQGAAQNCCCGCVECSTGCASTSITWASGGQIELSIHCAGECTECRTATPREKVLHHGLNGTYIADWVSGDTFRVTISNAVEKFNCLIDPPFSSGIEDVQMTVVVRSSDSKVTSITGTSQTNFYDMPDYSGVGDLGDCLYVDASVGVANTCDQFKLAYEVTYKVCGV